MKTLKTIVASITLLAFALVAVAVNPWTMSRPAVFQSTVAVTGAISGPVAATTLTVSSTAGITGVTTPIGGVAAAGGFTYSPRNCATGGTAAQLAADGNDSTPSVTETYYAEVFLPANATLTGIATFNGSATGSGNITVYLTNSAGTNLAHSASTAISGTDAYQRVPFTATYAAVGPATYYVVTQYNNTATRFNTFAVGNFGAGKDTGTTYGTFPVSPTIPTTFVTALAPIASLY